MSRVVEQLPTYTEHFNHTNQFAKLLGVAKYQHFIKSITGIIPTFRYLNNKSAFTSSN